MIKIIFSLYFLDALPIFEHPRKEEVEVKVSENLVYLVCDALPGGRTSDYRRLASSSGQSTSASGKKCGKKKKKKRGGI